MAKTTHSASRSQSRRKKRLAPPFKGAILVAHQADSRFDLARLKLIPLPAWAIGDTLGASVLHELRSDALWSAGAIWGQHALEQVWEQREKIPESQWPLGLCVYFLGTLWRNRRGNICGWCLMRYKNGWVRSEIWLEFSVGKLDLVPVMF